MLLQRVLAAAVGLPALLGAVWAGGPWLLAVALGVAGAGGWEFYRLAGMDALRRPLLLLGLGLILLVVANAGTSVLDARLVASIVAIVPLLGLLAWRQRDPLAVWGVVVVGVLYVGWLASHALLLRGLDGGREWLLFALLVTFATDTAAYGVGRAVGRHPLAPGISPGKTWEGAWGGVAGALLAALGLDALLGLPLAGWEALALGLGVSVAGQLGDLAESMLKRGAGVKEAGWLVPGHGGILDRLDSILFTLPVVYYVVMGRFG